MCTSKTRAPDTSAQEAEAARQRQLEDERYQARLDAENARWQQQRDDDQRRYDEQLRLSQEWAQKQFEQTQGFMEGQAADRAAERARAEEYARQQREYYVGRQELTDKSTKDVNDAYAGFNDDYFNKFKQDYLAFYQPQLEKEYGDTKREARYDFARAGTLNGSEAAKAFGRLNEAKTTRETEVANNAANSSQDYRGQIDQQKRDALGAIYQSLSTAAPIVPEGMQASDMLAGLGTQLAGLATGAKSAAAGVVRPVIGGTAGYSALKGAVKTPTAYVS